MSEVTPVKGQDAQAAQAAEHAKDGAWNTWINHVMDCTAECRTAGIDCFHAVELRREYRRTLMWIKELKLRDPMTAAPELPA